MTKKRFTLVPMDNKNNEIWYGLFDNQELEYVANVWNGAEKICKLMNTLTEENEQLKNEIKGMNKLLKSYRQTIEHNAELLVDATKNGYLPPLKMMNVLYEKIAYERAQRMEELLKSILKENNLTPEECTIRYNMTYQPVDIVGPDDNVLYRFPQTEQEVAKNIHEWINRNSSYRSYYNKRPSKLDLKMRALNCTDGTHNMDEIEYRKHLIEQFKKVSKG